MHRDLVLTLYGFWLVSPLKIRCLIKYWAWLEPVAEGKFGKFISNHQMHFRKDWWQILKWNKDPGQWTSVGLKEKILESPSAQFMNRRLFGKSIKATQLLQFPGVRRYRYKDISSWAKFPVCNESFQKQLILLSQISSCQNFHIHQEYLAVSDKLAKVCSKLKR